MKKMNDASYKLGAAEDSIRRLKWKIDGLTRPTYQTWLVGSDEREEYSEEKHGKIDRNFEIFLLSNGIKLETVVVPALETDEIKALRKELNSLQDQKISLEKSYREALIEVIQEHLGTPEKILSAIESIQGLVYFRDDSDYSEHIQLDTADEILKVLVKGKI